MIHIGGAKYGGGKVLKNFVKNQLLCNWNRQLGWKRDFFDDWFSLLPLMTVLKDQGIRATGTVRTDRLGKDE